MRRTLSARARKTLFLAFVTSLASPLSAAEPTAVPGPPSPDGRRTGGRFAVNYARSVVGVVSRDNLAPFLVTAGVTGVGAFFDDNVQRYFSAEPRAPWLGDAGQQLGQPYVIGPLALALMGIGRLNHHQSFRDATYDVAEVTLVAGTWTTALKYITHRERPDGSNTLSFPSGHTANAFSWAAVGAHYYGWKLGVPGYAIASLIGISRMEKNVHYLTDVLAGAGLGYISARSVIRRNSEPLSAAAPPRTARLSLAPMADPHGRGAGLRAIVAF